MCELNPGDVVLDNDGFVGTVRFVGKIPKSPSPEATWIGVEWADSARGKYDGSIYGDRYFECPPNKGSFLKPSKLRRGTDFATELCNKYTDDQPRPHIRVSAKYLVQRENGTSGAFTNLQNVDLSGSAICSAGFGVMELCPNLNKLNLANNLLSSWDEVVNLVKQLPNLELLNLSRNRLGGECHVDGPPLAPNLKTLILNDTGCQWAAVDVLLKTMPTIEELHVAGNEFTEVSLDPCAQVALLNLSANAIAAWAEVNKLATSTSLKTLLLCGNPLGHIDAVGCAAPEGAEPAPAFAALEHLSLDNTRINDWDSIDRLGAMTALLELNCAGLPLWEEVLEADRRKLTIGRLQSIQKLNRSPISDEERQWAERFLVRYYSQSAAPPAAYTRLRTKHGDLQPLAEICLTPGKAFVDVFFEDEPLVGFELDMSLSLTEFKAQVAKITGAEAAQQEVYHKSPYDFVQLRNNETKLHANRILDGDELHVRVKAPPRPKRTKQAPRRPALKAERSESSH